MLLDKVTRKMLKRRGITEKSIENQNLTILRSEECYFTDFRKCELNDSGYYEVGSTYDDYNGDHFPVLIYHYEHKETDRELARRKCKEYDEKNKYRN